MKDQHIQKISYELNLRIQQIEATASLISEGATVPFISRYRKEATGSLDEVQVTSIRDRLTQLEDLDKRREAILTSLEERNLLTDELKEKVETAETMATLEDIYLPFRPKRRTRATIAKEKGLEPLAQIIYLQQDDLDPFVEAEKYIDEEKELKTVEDVLQGARDIIAEWINEDQDTRAKLRDLFSIKGNFKCRVIPGKETEGIKYKDYYSWEESVFSAPSHRVLAMRRGENEGFLTLRILPPEEDALYILESTFIKKHNLASEQIRTAMIDAYKRLLSLSMETEIRLDTKQKADLDAIQVFADNLRQLLLAAPLGGKNVLAIDPGFRTGCKVVCLDKQGKLVHNTNIYPTHSESKVREAENTIHELCKIYHIEVIAIGNGTAGRETEAFVRKLNLSNIDIVMVNESGASIYSASDVAREEFADYDVTVRGSVSIGRRLQDPLAELVKIDPKSIGVGQYQHDVDQSLLRDKLDDVVVSCVNAVGVELNTASKQLLTYVSGLGSKLAQSVVEFRNENGPFQTREDILKVPRLGPKAFEQAAGFLRIRHAKNPLDRSAVHPESYKIVYKMAEDLKCSVQDIMENELIRRQIVLKNYISDSVGLPTLSDIMDELAKPGRDPRQEFEIFKFAEDVNKIEDLRQGMKLPGIVTNITNFGAFVDIGVHQDGLVHISKIANKFIKNPADVLKVHQKVDVTVMEIDIERKRIALSMVD
jgi:protein Tex